MTTLLHVAKLNSRKIEISDIEARVKQIVVEQLGVREEEVTATESFVDDLGAD